MANPNKPSKFGTFGGVFTPSLLTILGVIMYLRLPRVVGYAGLYTTLGIMAVAHAISIATGLSISSIATDKRVGAGGPYYVLSRSLGLPLGGTVGLALFIGLSFSISLYVIGFSESLLGYIGVEATPSWIRVVGTATLALLTIITFVSTSLAIKTQYIILALVALSLGSVFLGGEARPHALLAPAPDSPSTALLFGIFFPAVTGFTAGVNMSGDLKDPKRSIPIGTILAIATGLAIYVGLAVFLSFRVDPELLRNDNEVLLHVAWSPPLVIAGIWAATLSSALGSILGAPRILQSMSSDRVTPAIFAKGYGPTNEPRNALLLAFLVGETGILIAELDLIARVVSMVFLAMYGFVNIACAIENWSSPDFRPSFRIPTWVSVLGAVTSLLVMIQLDLLAMAGSLVLMLGLYGYLQRRRLTLHSGDAWEGVWSALIRSGLRHLSRVEPRAHNWKPNILAFSSQGADPGVHQITVALISSAGLATEFSLAQPSEAGEPAPPVPSDPTPGGFFKRQLMSPDPLPSIALLAQHHGFSGIQPNALLLPLALQQRDPSGFERLLGDVAGCDHNLLLVSGSVQAASAQGRHIDLWWHEEAGNFAFSVALARFLSRAAEFRAASVRFFLLARESTSDEVLLMEARQYLRQARLDAEVRLFHSPAAMRTPLEIVAAESKGAALVVAGLPQHESGAALHDTCSRAAGFDGCVLLYRAASMFPEVLRTAKIGLRRSIPPLAGHPALNTEPCVELALPDNPTLAAAITRFDERVRAALEGPHAHTVQALYQVHRRSLEKIEASRERLAAAVEQALKDTQTRARRELQGALAAFQAETAAELARLQTADLDEQRAVLRANVTEIMDERQWLTDSQQPLVTIRRKAADFVPDPSDTPALRRIKRRARWSSCFGRRLVKCRVPLLQLERYYHQRLVQAVVVEHVQQFSRDSRQLMLELSQALNRPSRNLALARCIWGSNQETEKVREYLAELGRVCQALVRRQDERVHRSQVEAALTGRRLVLELAADLTRLDARQFVQRERRLDKGNVPDPQAFIELVSAWHHQQNFLIGRVALGQQLADLMQRFSRRAFQTRDEASFGAGAGAFRSCHQLAAYLRRLSAGGEPSAARIEPLANRPERQWDPQAFTERLSADLSALIAEVPEKVSTISEESMLRLLSGAATDVEELEVNLRRGMDVMVSRELLVPLQQKLVEAKNAHRSSWSLLEDTTQLVAFQVRNSPEGLATLAERSLARVEKQLEQLRQVQASLHELVDRGLESIAAAVNVNELEKLQTELQRDDLYNRARAAELGAKSVLARLQRSVSRTMTDLLYRRSRGLLAARKLGATRRATAHVELRGLVEETAPRAEVTRELPRFYQQLFSGDAAVGGSFQVQRPHLAGALDDAIARWRRGAGGAILIVGEPGSGKTTRLQELLARLEAPAVLRIQAPEGGSAHLDQFKRALSAEPHGTEVDPFAAIADGTALVLDDLELWWERREGGLAVIELLLWGLRQHGRRLPFVLTTSTYAYDLLDRLVPFSSTAAAVLTCEPFSAEELRQAVIRRHQSTGLKFQYGSRSEEELSEWGVARLFTRYFDYSSGNIAAAFRGWLSHITKASGELLQIQAPSGRAWDALDEIDGDAKSLLLQLMLHKEASRERLTRIFGRDEGEVERVVRELVGAALLTEQGNGIVAINASIRHQVGSHFLKRGLL